MGQKEQRKVGNPNAAEEDSKILEPLSTGDASQILRKPKRKKGTMVEEIESQELKSLRHDLETARRVQLRLLPERIPMIPGYDFSSFYSPAGEVGGDFYDFIQFDQDHLGIIIADSSGKGLSGSLLMVEARAVLRSMALMSSSPKEVLIRTNQVLLKDLERGMFITIFYVLMEISTGKIKVASAGHMPMLLWRKSKKKCYAVNPSGLVLGMATEEMFNRTLAEKTVEMQPGDRICLYTDGVTELMDFQGNEYGNNKLVSCTYRNSHRRSDEYTQALVHELETHRSGFAQSDDITIVTTRMLPEEEWMSI